MKKIIIGFFMLLASTTLYAHHNGTAHAMEVGGVRCQSYQCQQAQQEIQNLLNAIYWEQQKPYPNWPAIQQAQQRIQWLRTIR